MPFVTPDFQAIRDAILRDILNQLPDASVGSDSDYYIRASAVASGIEGLYQHQQWIARQIFPDTADPDNLEKHAGLRGLFKKKATVAIGSIALSGNPTSPVLIGTEAKTQSGIAFLTTEAGALGGAGNATIAAQAKLAGVSGNQAAGTALTLTSAPFGVLSAASIVAMTGGTDIESNASLLSRLLFVLRNPPCGGAAHDYYTWAMNVAGVTAAYVYPNRRRIGAVDVAILTGGGIPGADLVTSVQNYIDGEVIRPVQGGFTAFAPTGIPVNISSALDIAAGYVRADVEASIDSRLASYFATFKPGATAVASKIRAIISDTPGVLDFTPTTPIVNVASLVDTTHIEIPVLGVRAWT